MHLWPLVLRSGAWLSVSFVSGSLAVTAVVIGFLGFTSPAHSQNADSDLFLAPSNEAPEQEGISVDGDGGREGAVRPLRQARGLIEADRQALIATEISGRIIEMPFRDGDRFSQGDTLVELDCSLLQAERAQARAELRAAQVTLQTNRELQALGSVGQLDLAISEADAIRASAALEAAEVQVSKCVIPAPFDGRVVETVVNRYESVNEGDDLLAILDDGSLAVRLIVPSEWLAWLAPEALFNFDIDETGAVVAGEVRALGAQIDPSSQTVPVFADVLDLGDHLIAGMSGTATFWDAPSAP